VRILESSNTGAYSVAYSPDGQHIVSGFVDGTIRIWDTTTGVPQHTLSGHKDKIRCVAFSPNSQLVASGSDDCTVRLWDITTGTQQYVMDGHATYIRSVSFSPDGQCIISTSCHWIQIWDATTGTQRHVIGHKDVFCAVSSPKGQYVISGSFDGIIRVWDMSTGMQQLQLGTNGRNDYIRSIAFSPDGQYIAFGSGIDGTVQVWDNRAGTRRHFVIIVMNDREKKVSVEAVAFSPDGQRIACGCGHTAIHVLDVKMGTQQYVLNGHEDAVYSVAFSPDGRHIVSASKDRTVRVWDAMTDAQHHSTSGPTCRITSLLFSPDGRYLVSGSVDNTMQMWDTTTGVQHLLIDNEHRATSLAFSPSGQLIALGYHRWSAGGDPVAFLSRQHTVGVWNAGMGKQQLVMHEHEEPVRCVTFSPNSQLIASGSDDCTVRVWDITTGMHSMESWSRYASGHDSPVN
jgi:WD40 repeat protein